jgi:hypothetical protein
MADFTTAILIRAETLPSAANTGNNYADAKEEIRSILQEQIGQLGLDVVTEGGDYVNHLRTDVETIRVDAPTETERAVIVDQFFVLFASADTETVHNSMRQVTPRRADGSLWPGLAWKPFDVPSYLAAHAADD